MKPLRKDLRKAIKPNVQTKKASMQQQRNREQKLAVAPVAVSNRQSFSSTTRGRESHRFANSELIGTLSAAEASGAFFIALGLQVNPGLAETFPWLSRQAVQWEFYRFHRLRFRYVTRTTTTTTGSVILSPEYSVKDPRPATEAEATNTADAVEDSVWKEVTCELKCSSMFPLGGRKLVRSSAVAADLNLYDAANFYACLVGVSGPLAVGKLWVDYDVEFYVAQNSPLEVLMPVNHAVYQLQSPVTLVSGTPTGIQWVELANPLHIRLSNGGVDLIPPKGVYRLEVYASADFTGTSALRDLRVSFPGSFTLLGDGRIAQTTLAAVTNPSRLDLSLSSFGTFSGSQFAFVSFLYTGSFSQACVLNLDRVTLVVSCA